MTSVNQLLVDNLFCNFKGNSTIQFAFEDKEALLSNASVINLSIHPIRFCDDIFFNFETNNKELHQKLKSYEVDYTIFYHYTDCIKAQMVRRAQKLSIPENSTLIVGQLTEDKAVFDGSRFLNLIDFSKQINDMCKSYQKVYCKLHPYQKTKRTFIRRLKKQCPQVEITTENTYTLLTHPSFVSVAALNSSVLYEAKYFGKEVIFFFKPQFDFNGNDIGIYGDYFSSKFWADILDIDDINTSLPMNENRLRRIFGDYWGYSTLSTSIDLKAALKNVAYKYIP